MNKKLVSGVMAGAMMLSMAAPAFAEQASPESGKTEVNLEIGARNTYTLTVPAKTTVDADNATKLADGLKVVSGNVQSSKRVLVTAASGNEWKLKASDEKITTTISYALYTDEACTTSAKELSFSAKEANAKEKEEVIGTTKDIYIKADSAEYEDAKSGSYSDTITFTAEVTAADPSILILQTLRNAFLAAEGKTSYADVNNMHAGDIVFNFLAVKYCDDDSDYNKALDALEAYYEESEENPKKFNGKCTFVVLKDGTMVEYSEDIDKDKVKVLYYAIASTIDKNTFAVDGVETPFDFFEIKINGATSDFYCYEDTTWAAFVNYVKAELEYYGKTSPFSVDAEGYVLYNGANLSYNGNAVKSDDVVLSGDVANYTTPQ